MASRLLIWFSVLSSSCSRYLFFLSSSLARLQVKATVSALAQPQGSTSPPTTLALGRKCPLLFPAIPQQLPGQRPLPLQLLCDPLLVLPQFVSLLLQLLGTEQECRLVSGSFCQAFTRLVSPSRVRKGQATLSSSGLCHPKDMEQDSETSPVLKCSCNWHAPSQGPLCQGEDFHPIQSQEDKVVTSLSSVGHCCGYQALEGSNVMKGVKLHAIFCLTPSPTACPKVDAQLLAKCAQSYCSAHFCCVQMPTLQEEL